MAQFPMGDIQRIQGKREQSLKNLKEALKIRLLVVPCDSIWALDIRISLLVAYRDFGMLSEAQKTVEQLEQEGALQNSFDRHCQVFHLKALLLADRGYISKAILQLEQLFYGTERQNFTRSFLWVILDLATLLRGRNPREGGKIAEVLFDHILVDQAPNKKLEESQLSAQNVLKIPEVDEDLALYTDAEEGTESVTVFDDLDPDPPRLLQLAEKALTLTRQRQSEAVDQLLQKEHVAWYRPQDLWVKFGGPPSDTSLMKAPIAK
ncbi:hypothetical protein D7B24_006725 [Verticillium nonalfalfae]|uniref:Uncharacterized protein n=1 Tax=Verticillium nonalfalfae TaxID=1051616 RepID=A0A3M9YJD5_9PEZI|nr:uncharacterized protein D7B24_006725 [Verticillium nonalfalfae]RNJ60657.1 hypothetical protein D7B24_006725 [Verticillium nonalfalfae]